MLTSLFCFFFWKKENAKRPSFSFLSYHFLIKKRKERRYRAWETRINRTFFYLKRKLFLFHKPTRRDEGQFSTCLKWPPDTGNGENWKNLKAKRKQNERNDLAPQAARAAPERSGRAGASGAFYSLITKNKKQKDKEQKKAARSLPRNRTASKRLQSAVKTTSKRPQNL